MQLSAGQTVEWAMFGGGRGRGTVERIDECGRVFVRMRQVNVRGRKAPRDVEVWFNADETARLEAVKC